MKTEEVCRTHGVSPTTFYKWKAKFGGMDVSDARKLKSLETENARLKRLLERVHKKWEPVFVKKHAITIN